ncbi:MAG: hypothetical protein KKG00_02980, partial [Bacteroidetes bacterium]|nr:hypothetical protein [Bacteroidota bacterium]
ASYVRWWYPQQLAASTILTQKTIYPFDDTALPLADSLRYYDVTVPQVPRQLLSAQAPPATRNTSSILIVRAPLSVPNLRSVKFRDIDSVQTDYLIVSHPLVRKAIPDSPDPVAGYAAYRASDAGGNFTALVLNADEVADQFNYGEPGPLGTRRLIRWLHDRARLRYVLLVGRSRSPQIVRKQANAREQDMIPSAGWPDSDIALGMGLDPARPGVPLVPIGRINASTPQHVWDYLQKVKQHEAAPPAEPWRKNVLHLSGGRSAEELIQFRNFVDDYAGLIDSSGVAPRLRTVSKQTDEPVERFDIAPQVNQGVALITLFGHSSLNITDIDIGFASNDALGYRNAGRYPAVLVNGCALGNFYFGPTPISTDWILAPNRGAVLFLAHTHNGLSGAMYTYSQKFYETLADPAFTSLGFGDIMREGTRRYLLSNPDKSARVTAQQMNLQGDPAIKIFPATRPDYAWDAPSVSITNTAGNKLTAWDDSVQIRAHVYNHGRFLTTPYSVRLRRLRGGQVVSEYRVSRPGVPRQDTLHLLLPNTSRQGGEETWELLLNPQGDLAEEEEDNNLLTVPLSVEEGGALALLPANEAILQSPTIELIAQLPGLRANAAVVFTWSQSPRFGADTRRDTVLAAGVVARRLLTLNSSAPQTIYWRVQIAGDPESPYRVFHYDPTGTSTFADWPEGIATLTGTYPSRLDEGEVLRARVSFENLSEVPFADSLLIAVREYGPGGSSERYFAIPPLAGKATFHYDFEVPTLGREGANRILITFNEGRLPEQRYINNSVELRYEVVPDAIPPVLDVLVDNRRLTNGEAIGQQPWL